MAWFGRRSQEGSDASSADHTGAEATATTEVAGTTEATATPDPEIPAGERGPWDEADADDRPGRVDLGAVQIPGRHGMALRMELDRTTRRVIAANVTIGQSNLQIQAFSAPRSAGIWEEIRTQIGESITTQGGQHQETTGPFGKELLALLPVKDAQGNVGRRPARFLGVDGPRWFLRGVLTGAAVSDRTAAREMEQYFSEIVVVRGADARPPSELLALTMPGRPPGSSEPEPEAATMPPDLTQRGPEISEVR